MLNNFASLLAVENLNRVRWHDKTINVVLSKHSSVKMPKDGSEVSDSYCMLFCLLLNLS